MASQWYRLDPATGRMQWQEAETRPGPGWESSDVPLFDSSLFPAPDLGPGETWRVEGTWTIQEDPPVYLQEETRKERPSTVATGLFQQIPAGELPAFEFRRVHPTEYRPPAPALQLMQGQQEEQQGPPPEHLAAIRQWIRRYYPETAAALDEVAPLPSPVSLVPRPADRGHSPRVRAWWQQVHRLSSVRRGRPTLPWRSGPRVAGHRKQGWT